MASGNATPISNVSTLLGKIKHQGSVLFRPKPTQPCWPNAEQSVGDFYDTIDDEKYWKLKNQQCTAFLAFSKLRENLRSILAKYTEVPLTPALWSVYMIGESACLCALGIIFCCGDADYRSTAARIIAESGAIKGSSGVVIRYRSRLLRSKGTLMPLSGVVSSSTSYFPQGSTSRSARSQAVAYGPPVLASSTKALVERSLGYTPRCLATHIELQSGDTVYVKMRVRGTQKATLGGEIKVLGQRYLATSAHSFVDQNPQSLVSQSSLDEESETGSILDQIVDVGSLEFSSILNSCPELDYALIKPTRNLSTTDVMSTEEKYTFPKFTSEESLRSIRDTAVVAATASAGLISGQIETIPDFLQTPGAEQWQEVYAVQFESALASGDSGSWVLTAKDKVLHGHIVAGVPQEGLAFLVPAYKMFADIVNIFDVWVPSDRPWRIAPRAWGNTNPECYKAIDDPRLSEVLSMMSQGITHGLSIAASYSAYPSNQQAAYVGDRQAPAQGNLQAYIDAVRSVNVIELWEKEGQRDGPWNPVGFLIQDNSWSH
ncbi:nicotinamide n-methyltransferase [Stagonosporopsis vannaccii]|nr:nicotinamide n-methyltransferase [Stagonosporopsis vannaccii]